MAGPEKSMTDLRAQFRGAQIGFWQGRGGTPTGRLGEASLPGNRPKSDLGSNRCCQGCDCRLDSGHEDQKENCVGRGVGAGAGALGQGGRCDGVSTDQGRRSLCRRPEQGQGGADSVRKIGRQPDAQHLVCRLLRPGRAAEERGGEIRGRARDESDATGEAVRGAHARG